MRESEEPKAFRVGWDYRNRHVGSLSEALKEFGLYVYIPEDALIGDDIHIISNEKQSIKDIEGSNNERQ
jgi:hypothetical protein